MCVTSGSVYLSVYSKKTQHPTFFKLMGTFRILVLTGSKRGLKGRTLDFVFKTSCSSVHVIARRIFFDTS